MNEIASIQIQMERMVINISHQIQDIYKSLYELRRLSLLMFELTPYEPEKIRQWIKEKAFTVGEDGFFRNKAILEAHLKQEQLPPHSMMYDWPASLKDNLDIAYNFYAQRNIGKTLEEIHGQLTNVSIIYYQDINGNTALAYPYFDISAVIPADFDWSSYFTYQSVSPEVNPERTIRWSIPNIDYAGEGLISIASLPVYKEDKLIGIWSTDVPFESIHKECILETFVNKQENFIVDFDGNIIIHPTVQTQIDKAKGSFLQARIEGLSEGFKQVDFSKLLEKKKGVFETTDQNGNEIIVAYHVIPEIKWVLFGSFLKDTMIQETYKKISKAFNQMANKNLQSPINIHVDGDMKLLVDNYNEMLKVVDYHQKEKEKALQQTFEIEKKHKEELENKVIERTKELKVANETKQKFFSIISHDLKGTFSVIIGLTDLLLRYSKHFDEAKTRSLIEELNKVGKNTLNLLMNLLQWSKAQSGHLNPKFEVLHLTKIAEDTVQQLLASATAKNISIKKNIDENISICADENMIRTVLRNLISNSIKFTENDGHITLQAEKVVGETIVSLTDTGVGIPKETVGKLFKINEHIKTGGTNKEVGSGLGLILCKEFVDMHSGKIWLETKEGKGSTFYFSIPDK